MARIKFRSFIRLPYGKHLRYPLAFIGELQMELTKVVVVVVVRINSVIRLFGIVAIFRNKVIFELIIWQTEVKKAQSILKEMSARYCSMCWLYGL